MNFFSSSFMIGLVYNLEAARRGFLGGTQLSLFLIKTYGLDWLGREHVEKLRTYLDVEQAFIDAIPDYLSWMVLPWIDHHDAGVTFCSMMDDLLEYQDPNTCAYYWGKYEEGGWW
jgi:hypothetical protein